MKFFLDENIEYCLALYLNQHGHNATATARDYPQALPDHEVLGIAAREQRILITDDRDYGELIFRQRQAHAGVIYVRLPDATLSEKFQRVDQLLITHREQLDQFIVVTRRSGPSPTRPPSPNSGRGRQSFVAGRRPPGRLSRIGASGHEG